jgi:hypothetical protein
VELKFVQEGFEETFCTDHGVVDLNQMMEIPSKSQIIAMLSNSVLAESIIKTENLYEFERKNRLLWTRNRVNLKQNMDYTTS